MIYDCFMFFNELDLLEIRLHVLAEVVDRFVLVEARQSHQRGVKPLYYSENRDRFAMFADRIVHVVVDEFPPEATTAAACENWQRNAIRVGIRDAAPGDTILISDVDEIPRPESVEEAATRGGVNIFRQLMFCYFLNCLHLSADGAPEPVWQGTVAYEHDARAESPQRYSELRSLSGWDNDRFASRLRGTVRRVRRFRELEGRARFVADGGWHFSYQGGVDAIVAKLEAFIHAEYNIDKFKDREVIQTAIDERRDLFGRDGRYEVVPLDERFPTWLQENAAARYGHLLPPER